MVGHPDAHDLIQTSSWGDRKGVLVDYLVTGIQLGDDKVDRGAIGKHAMAIGVVIWLSARKRRKESMVKIDDAAACKFPTCGRGIMRTNARTRLRLMPPGESA